MNESLFKSFPIPYPDFRGIPINRHPGAFGVGRRYDIHTGVDLYCAPRTPVFAGFNGTIVDVNEEFTGGEMSPWWAETYSIAIQPDDDHQLTNSVVVLYGELLPADYTDEQDPDRIVPGAEVKAGDIIGYVQAVLPASKRRLDIPGHNNAMLHLEMHDAARYTMYNWTKNKKSRLTPEWVYSDRKPTGLIDPTEQLLTHFADNPLPKGQKLLLTMP